MADAATTQLLAVLREGFDGPQHARTYFLDSGADAGLRNTLARLSPADASRERKGNSIAAHAHHILFSFDAFAAYISGDRAQRDWDESWRVKSVDDASWPRLQSDLGAAYDRLRVAIESHAGDEDAWGGAAGAVAHLAYHIGAIRQKLQPLSS